jgi:NRAMP (natural resistance-associated macrophage protein)-like metal ion transporter
MPPKVGHGGTICRRNDLEQNVAPMTSSLRLRVRSVALMNRLGPGLVTGAADDDPSGIATYSQAGAQAGFGLLWTMLLTYPLMSAVQLVSAQIGRVTGCGLAANMRHVLPPWGVSAIVALLFVANTINIGADLAAMGDAGQLVTGLSSHALTVGFAVISLVLQLFLNYRHYARMLKWLTLSLLAYAAVLALVRIDWSGIVRGLVIPHVGGADQATLIVAVFGTTISPYLFFWQSAQEVEEVSAAPAARPLKRAPWQAVRELKRIRFDTLGGMAFSNLIALAIMIACAATLHAAGKRTINTAAEAAQALRPVAGEHAFLLFAAGIIGTGLLAVPVLAGSAAYAIGESRGWKCGLEHKPWEARGFYAVIGAATLMGIAVDWSPVSPIKALLWSAVLNGIIAVPLMVAMMLVVSSRTAMGNFVVNPAVRWLGWTATAVMAVAVVAMAVV